MHRQEILGILGIYDQTWARGLATYPGFDEAEEQRILQVFRDFIGSSPRCFDRELTQGHMTGSAMVVSPDLDRVLLTLHGKLNIWLQLGGHADSHPRLHDVAMREALEESGLTDLGFLPYESLMKDEPLGQAIARSGVTVPLPFDFDYHHIPARKAEPAHIHYDVRYVIVADPGRPLTISDESHDLRWFTMDEARGLTDERSMHRQFDKLAWLRNFL